MFKSDNELRDKIIHDVVKSYETKSLSKENWTWLDVSISVGKVSGQVVTPNACRKAYKRYLDKHIVSAKQPIENIDFTISEIDKNHNIEELKKFDGTKYHISYKDKDSYENAEPIKEKHIDKSIKIEKRDDGSVVSDKKGIENIEEGTLLSDEDVLRLHNLDPLKWIVKSHTDNWYESNGGKDFGIIKLCQSKLIAEPIVASEKLTISDVRSFINTLSENKFEHNFKLIPLNDSTEKYCLEIDWADIHLGSLSDEDEVGENNDYKIAFGNIKKVVARIRQILETGKVEKIVHCFLGDFLHFDNVEGQTVQRTQLDSDSRPLKMIKKAFEISMYIIDNTAIVPMEVNSVLGNHSIMVEFCVFWALGIIYRDVKHITFNVDERSRKVFAYGKNLVGLTHGNNIAKTEQDLWLQNEFRQEWANCTYAEVHSGHLHQEILFSEKGGITKRTNPTLKVIDKYEHDHAWSSKKVVLGYLWSKEDNLKQIYYLK